VNWRVPATATVAGFGLMAIDVSAITVSVTPGEVTVPIDAVICVVPPATPVASPPEAVMVAVAVVPEAHVTVAVISAVELSLYVPVAVNCCVAPTFKCAGDAGVTAIEVIEMTVSVTPGEVTVPIDAVICVVPPATPVASPPEAVMVAVAVVPEAHVTVAVISAVELSLYVPVAVNCCVAPAFKCAGDAGVTAIEVRVFVLVDGRPLHPVTNPTNNSGATTAKRRRRDFISPPQKAHPKFFCRHTNQRAT